MKNNNVELENMAHAIINKTKIPIENYGGVVLTLMFISIILTSIRILQECHKNKDSKFYGTEIRNLAAKKSWFTKMRLKKIIRQQLKSEDYRQYKDDIVSAILDVAENLTDEQMLSILDTEVKND